MKQFLLIVFVLLSEITSAQQMVASTSVPESQVVVWSVDQDVWSADSTTFKRRDPGMALFLSMILPGGGQFYNGQGGKGTFFLLAGATSAVLFVSSGPGALADLGNRSAGTKLGFYGMIGIGLWSMIDAPIMANRLNRENGVAFRMQPMLQDGGKGTFALGPKLSISF